MGYYRTSSAVPSEGTIFRTARDAYATTHNAAISIAASYPEGQEASGFPVEFACSLSATIHLSWFELAFTLTNNTLWNMGEIGLTPAMKDNAPRYEVALSNADSTYTLRLSHCNNGAAHTFLAGTFVTFRIPFVGSPALLENFGKAMWSGFAVRPLVGQAEWPPASTDARDQVILTAPEGITWPE